MPEKNQGITSVLNAMLESVSMEGAALYAQIYDEPMIAEAREHAQNHDFDRFFLSLGYPVQQMVDAVVEGEFPHNQNAQFLMANARYLENHLDSIFTKFEGSACSHDKTKAVLHHLMNFFMLGKRIEFNYGQQYTYHLPKKVLRDHDSIIAMFDALHYLHYGNPDRYFRAYEGLLADAAAP